MTGNEAFLKDLDALIAVEVPPPLEDDDLTIMRLCNRASCGTKKAKLMIEKWVKAGQAEYIGKRTEIRGHAVDAWRLVITKGTE